MATMIEQDLRDYLQEQFGEINKRFDEVKTDIKEIKNDLKKLEIGQVRLEGEIKALDEKLSGEIKTLDKKLSGEIKTLDEKVEGINKRLDFQEFINRSVLGGVVIAMIIGLVKVLGFLPKV